MYRPSVDMSLTTRGSTPQTSTAPPPPLFSHTHWRGHPPGRSACYDCRSDHRPPAAACSHAVRICSSIRTSSYTGAGPGRPAPSSGSLAPERDGSHQTQPGHRLHRPRPRDARPRPWQYGRQSHDLRLHGDRPLQPDPEQSFQSRRPGQCPRRCRLHPWYLAPSPLRSARFRWPAYLTTPAQSQPSTETGSQSSELICHRKSPCSTETPLPQQQPQTPVPPPFPPCNHRSRRARLPSTSGFADMTFALPRLPRRRRLRLLFRGQHRSQ